MRVGARESPGRPLGRPRSQGPTRVVPDEAAAPWPKDQPGSPPAATPGVARGSGGSRRTGGSGRTAGGGKMWEEVGEEESLPFGTLQFSRMKGLFGPHSSQRLIYLVRRVIWVARLSLNLHLHRDNIYASASAQLQPHRNSLANI